MATSSSTAEMCETDKKKHHRFKRKLLSNKKQSSKNSESATWSSGSVSPSEFSDVKINQSPTYANSEISEQSCLKPSLTKALFSHLDATHWPKTPYQRRTVRRKLWSADCDKEYGNTSRRRNSLVRASSVPGFFMQFCSDCHCIACCTCSPNQRLSGACPAYVGMISFASLDQGLDNIFSTSSSKCVLLKSADTAKSKYNTYPMGSNKQWVCSMCGKENAPSTSPAGGKGRAFVCVQCKEKLAKNPSKSQASAQTGSAEDENQQKSISRPFKKVAATDFKHRAEKIEAWFADFNDYQKNTLLTKLLAQCDLPQTHLICNYLRVGPHPQCPPNCQDRLGWLPDNVALIVFSYLDPVSLGRCECVCKAWLRLASTPFLWRHFCSVAKWQLSRTGEQKQILQHILPDGQINWRQVFVERYRLRQNWLFGKCTVRTFEGHTQGISCVQFDDTRIVSGSSDKMIKVWNIRTNSPWTVQTLVGHSGTVRCLHLEGNRLVSGSSDNTIKVWDLSTQQSWSSIACKVTMTGHDSTVRCLQVDDEKVISGSYDFTLKIWDLKTGHCRKTLRGHEAAVLCVRFDSQKIVSGSCDKSIKVWSLTGECLMTLLGHQEAVTCLQFDSRRIVSGSIDCTLRFWDIGTGRCVNTIDWKASEGHTGVVRCLQADSWKVVSGSDDRTLKVWSLETGQRLVTLRNHTDGVTCLQFNDAVIVSGSYDQTVKLWDFSCV